VSAPAIVHVMGWHSQQYGSFERFLVALASRCAEQGAQTHLVFPSTPASLAFAHDVHAEVHAIASPRGVGDPRFALRLAGLVRGVRATHLHVHFGVDAYHATATATLLAIPGRYATKHIRPGSSRRSMSRARHRWLAARVRVLLAVSQDVREHLLALGVPANKVEVCRLGVDPAAYRGSRLVRAQVRQELGIRNGSHLVLTTSHLRPGKGMEILPAVTADLLASGLDVTVVAAGDGPLRNQLELEAARLDLTRGRLHLIGVQQDVSRLLAAADLFLFPASGAEGLPLGPLEALAAGAPVVATTVSDLATLLPGAALLVAPDDQAALVAACRRVLGDPQLAASMRRRGRELVEGRLNVARAVDVHTGLYFAEDSAPTSRPGTNQ
jgi:glycosyltransferase involved in cell wall biosynthesis